jgi:serine/threonine protein kinase
MAKRFLYADEPDSVLDVGSYPGIIKIIARGSFNCAVKMLNKHNEKEVLRVALLSSDDDRDFYNFNVLRGLEIVHMFQQFSQLLGPSLIVETQKYELWGTLDPHTLGLLCNGFKEAAIDDPKSTFAVQHLEYAKEGNLTSWIYKLEGQQLDFFAFSLIWFFRQASSNFKFRHADLKLENIVVRKTAKRESYMFISEAEQYVFVSDLVPVVIDFDFATVMSSKNKQNKQITGTYYTAPPHALMFEILDDLPQNDLFIVLKKIKAKVYAPSPACIYSYDWWSLGIILFSLYTHIDLYNNFMKKEIARVVQTVADNIQDQYRLPMSGTARSQIHGMLIGALVASIVHEDGNLVPPLITQDNYSMFGWFLSNDNGLTRTSRYNSVAKQYRLQAPAHIKQVLKALLSWTPEERVNPVEKYFQSNTTEKRENIRHVYSDNLSRMNFQDAMDTTKHALLLSELGK